MSCVKGYYSSTDVVKFSRPLVCYGGNGQPECDNLSVCRQANGMRPLTRAKCRYCGKTDPNIVCHGLPECGKIIPHHKHSYSIGHTCHGCNMEFGKGE